MSKTAEKTTEEAPKTRLINGQAAVRVDCPLRAWTGHIYVALELTTPQFLQWWEKYQENGGDGRESVGHLEDLQRIYDERRHMILSYQIDGFDPEKPAESLALLNFFAAATQPLVLEARFMPNLPKWSSGFTNGTARPGESA